jgi:hypothetical protein
MKSYRILATTAALAAFAFAGAAPAQAADGHSHGTPAADSHAAAPHALALNQGKRWVTDAPLRRHMTDIRALVAAELEPIHRGTLSSDDYKALGEAIEAKVGAIVADCKLPPDADAMLHLIVADLLAGADVLQGKTAGDAAAAAHKVVVAVDNYGKYFDHPGFAPLG